MPRSTSRAVPEIDFVSRRSDMVEHQIAARGVRSKLVLEAMRKVPREEFLPLSLREFAYEDSPLPIAEGQTISQPYIVAFMGDALLLKGGEQVLEIGTGSGYVPRRYSPKLRRMSIRSNGSGSWPKRRPSRLPSWAVTMCMCCMPTAPKAGQSTRPTMRLWSLLAVPKFQNRSSNSSR